MKTPETTSAPIAAQHNQMQIARPSVLGALAERLEIDPGKLQAVLKKTAFAACKTEEEFAAMCIVANKYNLDPITKEIYAFPNKAGAIVPVVGVDGWIKIMVRAPEYDGIEFSETPESCTATIYLKNRAHPVRVTEWLAECDRGTDPWKRWPRRMLRHKAMIQAARLAFGFSGIMEQDEAERAAEIARDVPAAKGATPAAQKLRNALNIPPEEIAEAEVVSAPEPAYAPAGEPLDAGDADCRPGNGPRSAPSREDGGLPGFG